jgi:hypothetical protein
MHNWYHPNVSGILYIHGHRLQCTTIHGAFPLLSSPLADSPFSPLCLPLAPPLTPLYLLGTLLAVTGSVHLGLRLLVNWPPLSQPFAQTLPPLNSQNPNCPRLTKTTSGIIRCLLSGTFNMESKYINHVYLRVKDGKKSEKSILNLFLTVHFHVFVTFCTISQ